MAYEWATNRKFIQSKIITMYAIYANGQFLANRIGWGPTFTMFRQDAKTFKTEHQASSYIDRYLSGFGCSVMYV